MGSLEPLAPEVRLVLACAADDGSERQRARVREAIEKGVDWAEVRAHAGWHGLTCQVGDALERHAADLVPPDVLDELRRRRRATAHRNLFLFSRLVELLELFDERGIAAIPFKGSVLAHTVYRDPSLREFADLDILVPRNRVGAASALLDTLGFRTRSVPEGERPPPADEWIRYARAYTRPSDGVTVDLHWHIAPATFRAGIRIERLLAETETSRLGGRSLRTFTPEATLLVLCIHGAKHGPVPWARLKWMRDVDRMVRDFPELDWNRLSKLADELGCRRILGIGLALSADVLGTPVSPALLRSAREDPVTREIVEEWQTAFLGGHRIAESARPDVGTLLLLRERWRDRVTVFLRHAVIPRPRDWGLVKLPSWLGFLYVPIRMGRLAIKFLVARPQARLTGRSNGAREA